MERAALTVWKLIFKSDRTKTLIILPMENEEVITQLNRTHIIKATVESDDKKMEQSSFGKFDSCQFIYTSRHDNQSRIVSPFHGAYGWKIDSAYRYCLDDEERIEEVSVKSEYLGFPDYITIVSSTKIIKGLRFVTTKVRIIPPDIRLEGDGKESERYLGYTLGYATDKEGLKIDQLQFF